MTIRVAVADDHPAMLAGMEHLLSAFAGIEVIGLVTDSTRLVELLGSNPCDVVVTDFSMPAGRYGDGISLLRFLQRRFPTVSVVVLTGVDSATVLRSILDMDVRAVVSKSDDYAHLETAIHMAHESREFLSPEVRRIVEAFVGEADVPGEASEKLSKREAEVLRLFAEGLSVMEIGNRVGRSRKTISTQKNAAMKKLGLERDADVFRYAISHGLVPASQSARYNAADPDRDE
ncbi:LuxR family two component transcriptional regulator [Luteibacter rhizovicinus]|uniref:LuxR family two component transcriptional regulator n=1 Tax=Luteibacter rhizovicinus TaxID=242606 RepID=A0A4R3YVC6_9GAMM|nr:response regulator transcription factor [Luteibacter rhizovicinus]TCV96396.1 LuxR family two component transcriptional regulator [Luteibacter rhizovicinus]